jgi:hypothetical protein
VWLRENVRKLVGVGAPGAGSIRVDGSVDTARSLPAGKLPGKCGVCLG